MASVRVETNLTPPITIDAPTPGPFGPAPAPAVGGGGGLNDLVLRIVRPRVTVDTGAGVAFTTAPWGEPGPFGAVVGAAIAFGAAWAAFKLGVRLLKG